MPPFKEFSYTDEQWEAIARSVECLHPDEASLQALRESLDRLLYMNPSKADARPAWDFQEEDERQASRRNWKQISKTAHRLLELFLSRAVTEQPGFSPFNGHYRHELDKVLDIYALALENLEPVKRGKSAGFGGLTIKQFYMFFVLREWTTLGGALKFSRHPKTGKITGPLARYFVSVTQPVIGGSIESLPDVIARQKWLSEMWEESVRRFRARGIVPASKNLAAALDRLALRPSHT